MNRNALAAVLFLALWGVGCQARPPIQTAASVDLGRFMGDWHVIASIPTPFEKGAHNGLETYRPGADGTVEITFRFNQDGFDGPEKTIRSRGFIRDGTQGAVWDVQFFWPLRAEYRVLYLNPDYTQTVIGRTKRDYAWIMARSPSISAEDYDRLLNFLAGQGYDVSRVVKVPQQTAKAP